MKPNQPKIDIPANKTAKLLGAAAYILLLALWALCFYVYVNSPDTVAIHFNAKGEADGYGSKAFVLLTPGIATVLFIFISLLLRVPHLFNYLVVITPENAAHQYRKAQNMLRIINIAILLMMLTIEAQPLFANHGKLGLIIIIFEVLFVLIVPIFIVISATSGKDKAIKEQ